MDSLIFKIESQQKRANKKIKKQGMRTKKREEQMSLQIRKV